MAGWKDVLAATGGDLRLCGLTMTGVGKRLSALPSNAVDREPSHSVP